MAHRPNHVELRLRSAHEYYGSPAFVPRAVTPGVAADARQAEQTEQPPMARIRAESRPNEFIEHLVFTWDFRPVGERTCRLDLTLDFELRQPEHVLIWTMTNEKIISECARDGHYKSEFRS